jgi:hypothetical protein
MEKYLKEAAAFGVPEDNPSALCFWCEIEHLGGLKASKRIFTRCNGNYSIDNIMVSLKQDQYDDTSNQQVGDSIFWSRHQCIYNWCKYLQVSSPNVFYMIGSMGDGVKDLQHRAGDERLRVAHCPIKIKYYQFHFFFFIYTAMVFSLT